MKYSVSVEIDKPVSEVIQLFDDPDNLKKWMEGLISFETIEGSPGQEGTKARMFFKMGNREVEMIETITVRDFPREFSGTYEAKGVFNIVRNFFTELPGNKTKYTTEHEFQFKGFMKVFSFLMPGAFTRESRKQLNSFKAFAESQD